MIINYNMDGRGHNFPDWVYDDLFKIMAEVEGTSFASYFQNVYEREGASGVMQALSSGGSVNYSEIFRVPNGNLTPASYNFDATRIDSIMNLMRYLILEKVLRLNIDSISRIEV